MSDTEQLGTTVGTLADLADYGLKEPAASYLEFTTDAERSDGLVSGMGWGLVVWRWAFISLAARNAVKALCPGRSAELFAKVEKPDGTWGIFSVILIWPDENPPLADKIFDWSLTLRLVEEQP